MGYCISQIGCGFFIKSENKAKVLEAMKGMMKDVDKKGHGGSFSGGGKTKSWYSWVDTDSVLNAKTAEEALSEWGYETEIDDKGNINSLMFQAEKLGQEFEMFEVIAPFVKDGSYIEMHGEDGATWRWAFKKGKCLEQHAKLSYDND